MDKVQIYCCGVGIVMGLTLVGHCHKNEGKAAITTLLSVAMYLPLVGRIFGWW